MSEEENKPTGEEENPSGDDKAGVDKTTAEALIERSEKLSEDNAKLKSENEELRMQAATHKIGGITTAGKAEEKKEQTDKEYAEAATRGDYNGKQS